MAFPDLDPNHVFRDFTTHGVPASGKWDPRKVEIRRLLKSYESAIIALIGGQGGDIDLVRGVIYFSVTGGTANDIIAEPDAELPENPGSTVYIIGGIAQDNTGPVTINGKPLLTNSGNEIAAGGIVGGGIYLFLDVGANYRLLSDQASAAIVAAAEAAAAAAENAKDLTLLALAGAEIPPASPNSMIVDDPTAVRQTLPLVDVATLLANQSLPIGSAGRSALQRFGDVVDLDDWLVGDGATNNDARFDALLSYMAANPGKTYRSRNGRVYACSFINKVIPASARLRLEGARFLWNGPNPGAGNIISLAQGVDADAVRVEIVAGASLRRGIDLNGARVDLVELIAQVQTDNRSVSLLDYGVRLILNESRVGEIKVKNLDNGVCLYGTSLTTGFCAGSVVGHVDIENYSTGLYCRNVSDINIKGYWIRGRSPNATPDPGHNGILTAGVSDVLFGQGVVENAAEHGIRLGGTYTGELATRHVKFVSPTTRKSNQSGFKVYPGTDQVVEFLTVVGGTFLDSGEDVLGFNDFGMMVQRCVDSQFVGCQVAADEYTRSGYDGIYVHGPNRVHFEGLRVANAQRNGLRLSERGSDVSPFQEANSTSLTVNGFHSEGHTAEGIYIEFPGTSSIRDTFITNAHIIGGTDGVGTNAAAARFVQPSYISAVIRGQSGVKFNVPSTTGLKTVDMLS